MAAPSMPISIFFILTLAISLLFILTFFIDIILQIPARTKPENIMKKFHDIIENMTSPQSKEKPSFEYRIKHTNRSFQVTVKGKHEGYEPMVVLMPKDKVKSFAKRYNEYILKEETLETD